MEQTHTLPFTVQARGLSWAGSLTHKTLNPKPSHHILTSPVDLTNSPQNFYMQPITNVYTP
jgi:hypothetical protein